MLSPEFDFSGMRESSQFLEGLPTVLKAVVTEPIADESVQVWLVEWCVQYWKDYRRQRLLEKAVPLASS